MIKNIKLSQRAKDQLVALKRQTGIQQWNILCRWAFCLSLAEATPPRDEDIPADSNVEMSWETFGGAHHEIYMALLKERCTQDGIQIEEKPLSRAFRQHLHRGIGYLAYKKLFDFYRC